MIGKKLLEAELFELSKHFREMMAELRSKDVVRLKDVRPAARDGKLIDVEMVATRYTVAGEEVIQCNIRDITKRKRAENDLQRSNEDLQQFAYAASHDLQELLRTVRSYSQLLVRKYQPVLDEEGRKFRNSCSPVRSA